jgi:hypothetical protein
MTSTPEQLAIDKLIKPLIEKLLADVEATVNQGEPRLSAFDLVVCVLHALAHDVGRVMTPHEVLDARDAAEYEFDACNRDQLHAAFAGIMENLGLELELPV